MIQIKLNKTGMVYLTKTIIGRDGENLQDNFVVSFEDEFINGVCRLEYEINGTKEYKVMAKENETYTLPIKNVLTKEGKIQFQIVIVSAETEDGTPIFKSNIFYLMCNKSINAEQEGSEEYTTLLDILTEKIAEIDKLDITSERVTDGVEITITDKQGIKHTTKVNDGFANLKLSILTQAQYDALSTKDANTMYIIVN